MDPRGSKESTTPFAYPVIRAMQPIPPPMGYGHLGVRLVNRVLLSHTHDTKITPSLIGSLIYTDWYRFTWVWVTYAKPYPKEFGRIPQPPKFMVPDLSKFNHRDSTNIVKHVSRYTTQLRLAASIEHMKVCESRLEWSE